MADGTTSESLSAPPARPLWPTRATTRTPCARGIFPCFPINRSRHAPRPFHRGYYRLRHRVENFLCALKHDRRVATRYEKLAASFLAFVAFPDILHRVR